MAGMSRKEISRLLDHIEPQGVRLTRTTKGVLLRLPDGTSTMLHFTGSDVREPKNVRARLKRAGVSWPGDEDTTPLPQYVLNSKPTKATLAKVADALEGWDNRYINASQLRRIAGGMTNATAQSALFHLGWTPLGKSTARKWMRPLELEPDTLELEAPLDVEAEAEVAALEAQLALEQEAPAAEPESPAEPLQLEGGPDEAPAPQLEPEPQLEPAAPEPESPQREFIDSTDSWVIDPELHPHQTLGALLRTLESFGLQGELRVWRAGSC